MGLSTNILNVGYYGSHDMYNAQMAPMSNSDTAPYSDSSFLYDPRPLLQSSQLASASDIYNNYLQTYPYLQQTHDNTSNDSYLPVPQQPAMQTMPLRPSSHSAPISDLPIYNEPKRAEYPGTLARADYAPSLVLNGGLVRRSDARDLPVSFVDKSKCGIMTVSAASVEPTGLNPFGYDISTTDEPTRDHDTTPLAIMSAPPRTQHSSVAGRGQKRALSPTCGASQELSVAHDMSQRHSGTVISLDNLECYVPLAKRQVNRAQKRSRIGEDKEDWACLACWMVMGKVSISRLSPSALCYTDW